MEHPDENTQAVWPQMDTRHRWGRVGVTVAIGVAVFAVLLVLYALWGVRTIRRTLIAEAERDGIALVESILLASQYSVTASLLTEQLSWENLATRARLAAAHFEGDADDPDSLLALMDLAEAQGVTIWRTDHGPVSYPDELQASIQTDPDVADYAWTSDELAAVPFELTDTLTGDQWIGAGVSTAWGGLAIWQWIEGSQNRPAWSGIGTLIREIGQRSEINYIMLQTPEGIVFASRSLPPVLRLADDEFLVSALDDTTAKSREIVFEGVKVLEVVKPFLSADLPSGMFRVGISLEGVEAAQNRLVIQLGLSAVLLLLLATAALAYVVARRSYSDLHRSYQRVETLTQRILDAIDQAVVAADARGRLTVFNRAAERLFGRSRSATKEETVVTLLGSDDYELGKTARGGDPVHDREYPLRRGRETRQLVFSTTPVITADGRREGAVSVVRDETEARAMAEQMQRNKRLTEMGNLAAGVAHEIRNPLNAISVAAQRLRMELTDPAAAKIADTMLEETRRLNTIVENFLSLARPSQQPKSPIDLSGLVESVASMAAMEAGQKGIAWTADLSPGIFINGVADELRKAVWNILSNAIAATPGDDGTVEVRLVREEGKARLTITDSGSGIDEDDLGQIFQPYFTTKRGGTGLGLAITHRILSDHDGTITIQSPPADADKGTRVVVELHCTQG
jgi:two-component system sensor histidine kinase HydH